MPHHPSQPQAPSPESLRDLEPVPTLLHRIRAELSAEFDSSRPIRISRAPGRLDVMGGIAEYTGSLVLQLPIDRAASIALQSRADRQLQIFSFNQYNEHLPFTFRIPLEALAQTPLKKLHEEFAQPGRRWAAPIAGCLFILHESKWIDLTDPKIRGLNLTVYSTVPPAIGAGACAAVAMATMMNLIDHFALRARIDSMQIATLCHAVQNRVAGIASGMAALLCSCLGETGSLVSLLCQPHEIQPPLGLPPGARLVGINSDVKRPVANSNFDKTRCAAFMGHKIILTKMQEMGQVMGRPLWGDPMHGYLANLDPEDYKKLFRRLLPENMSGQQFLEKFGFTIDTLTKVSAIEWYQVQHALDHHVLEARRVRHFAEFIQQAVESPPEARKKLLDKAGHLMYASHLSYTNDAMLGCDECDLLVNMVHQREGAGLYGARITGAGAGGMVAVLAEDSPSSDAAIDEILTFYHERTGLKPEAIPAGGLGSWRAGTIEVK